MRPIVSAIASLLIIIAACPLACAYVGDDNDLAVYITYPDVSYDVGSDVIVTVTTFKAAQYYDPATVELKVGETQRWVGLTKEDIGRYKGVVTIQLADLARSGYMGIYAQATDVGAHDPPMAYGYVSVMTLVGSSFTVSVRVPETTDNMPVPDQDVDFVVGIDFRGSPVDPDAGTLKAFYTDLADYRTDLALTRVGTGQFQGKLTVPASLKESARYTLKVEANCTKDSRTYEGKGEYDVFVNFLDVWAHLTTVTPAQTRLEVNVLGLDGLAVAGAAVSLDYIYYDDGHEQHKVPLSGTTDAAGVATFTMAYADLGMETSNVIVTGRVKAGALTQLFEGVLQVREPQPWDPSTGMGFEAWVLTEGPLAPGTSVTVQVQTQYNDVPMVSQLVYFYLTDDHTIFRFSSATTDAQGKFSFPLNTPALMADEGNRYIVIECQTETVAGWRYSADSIKVGPQEEEQLLDELIDPQTTMAVDPFSIGDTVTVTLDDPAADGVDENAFVLWQVGNASDRSLLANLEWANWAPGTIPAFGLVPCVWSDGRYVATFQCPGFLNTSSKLYMYGFITFTDQADFFEGAKVAKLEKLSPLPPNPAPTSAFTTPVASQRYGGTLGVRGTASDDKGVSKVELRLDGGAWMTVSGTTSWSYDLDTRPLAAGNHTLEVRSYDGQRYSTVTSVTFVVDQSVGKKKDKSPGFGVALCALAILAAVLVAVAGRRRG